MKRNMKNRIKTSAVLLLFSLLPATAVLAAPEDENPDANVVSTEENLTEENLTEDNSTEEATQGSTISPTDSIFYTGPIDLITGQPLTEESGESSGQLVQMGNGASYDRYSRRYIYPVGNSRILCSVADGMIVTDGVVLSKDGEMNLSVYKDGESMSEIPSEITAVGDYVVVTGSGNTQNQLLTFQIVNSVTGRLQQYILPTGFVVQNVRRDGESLPHEAGSVKFDQEGDYVVDYICNANSAEYTLKVRIDHTPPQISFAGLDEDNEARGPVTIQGMEEGDTISIIFDGEESVNLDDEGQVSETGRYHVVVTDVAGNSIEKDFEILLYLNFNATMFIVALLLVVIGVCTALLISRKKLRVR